MNSFDLNPTLIFFLLIATVVIVAVALYAFSHRDDEKRSQRVLEEVVAGRPPTFVRMYSGHRQADTNPQFQSEAGWLSELGYQPISHSWAAGEWGFSDFLVAAVLSLFGIGLLFFAYMWTVKPDGSLSVLYAESTPGRTSSSPIG